MAKMKILVKGKHTMIDNKCRISSTSTLIKSENKNIIIDTSSFLEKNTLVKELKKENLTPKDIDIVIITHLHLDHIANLYLFENAKIYTKFTGTNYPGQIHRPKIGTLQREEIYDGKQITKDVSLILTPGHTKDMISVIAKTDFGIVVVAGDAIRIQEYANLKFEENPMLIDNSSQFNKSRKKILEIADYIIPGHGNIFKLKK